MSLEQELKVERVTHLDLSGFSKIASGSSVRNALAKMQAEKHNVCLVTDGNDLIGILTDRDVLRKVVNHPEKWDAPVDEMMTPDPVTITPDTSAAEALWLMDEKHFRNLPVVDSDGTIVGDMTHQAVINYLATRYPVEVLNRPPNPDQFPRKQEGG